MIRKTPIVSILAAVLLAGTVYAITPHPAAPVATVETSDAPRYDDKGRLLVPGNYREWIFLSSGLDMRYNTESAPPTDHVFSNVYAPQAAYRVFQTTGTWPDHTILILENRTALTKGSINRAGKFQTGRINLEAHVRDRARFKGGWGFFIFDGDTPSERIDYRADCYSCHRANAAVDTTFVQFYPTLLPIATRGGTLNQLYLAHEANETDAPAR